MFTLQNNHASCGASDGLSKLNFQSHGVQIIYYNHKLNRKNNKIKFGI